MSKIVDYVVLYQQDEDALTKDILDLSSDGYSLAGGICAYYEHQKDISGVWLYQAMVKYEVNE